MESPSIVGAGSAHQPSESSIARPASRAMHAEIADRLRIVCAHLPPDDFDALVAKIADFKYRWSQAEMDARAHALWPARAVEERDRPSE
jgi:hypothetical protein